MEKMVNVFVYGTLKKGEGNHHLLAGRSVLICENVIKGELFDLGPFPAMKEGDGKVHGEVYAVGPETLKDLDVLEGHPTFYERKPVKLLFDDMEAEAYFYQGDFHGVAKRLDNGVWSRRKKIAA